MKMIYSMIAGVLITVSAFAQSPEKMSYQAVVRDGENNLVSSTTVGIQVSILQGSANGTAVYTETQTPTTNANGLFSLEIGEGTVVSGDFSAIDWANGPYFIKTETDPTGGTNYTITGTSQLLSVPYALHAKSAETITGGITENDPIFGASVASGITAADTTNWNNKQDQLVAGTGISIVDNTISATGGGGSNDFYLGQDTLGGIVYYIYLDANGNQHGLIVSKTEGTATWGTFTLVGSNRTDDGVYNTNLMPSNSNAKAWVATLGPDWYLPSIDELDLLYQNRFYVNKTARAINATQIVIDPVDPQTNTHYWSSTEFNAPNVFYLTFLTGGAYVHNKTVTCRVRGIKAF